MVSNFLWEFPPYCEELLEFLALQIADPFSPKGGHRKKARTNFLYSLCSLYSYSFFFIIVANKWCVAGVQRIECSLNSESREIKGKGGEGSDPHPLPSLLFLLTSFCAILTI